MDDSYSFTPYADTSSFSMSDYSEFLSGLSGGTSEYDFDNNISNEPTPEWKNTYSDGGILSTGLTSDNSAVSNTVADTQAGSDDSTTGVDTGSVGVSKDDYGDLGYDINKLDAAKILSLQEENKPISLNTDGDQNPNKGSTIGKIGDFLETKAGAAIAAQLVGGLLGGVGNSQLLSSKHKFDKELMDKQYSQKLDYINKTGPAEIKRQEWKPVLKSGILGK